MSATEPVDTENKPAPAGKDAELEQRRRKLEEELDQYAQAGVVSPGLLRSAKWLSRILYMAMAALVVFLLFSGWGKVSQEDFDTAVKNRDAWAKKAKDLEDRTRAVEQRLSDLLLDVARSESTRRETEAQIQGPRAADAAVAQARALVERAWGEQAYSRHWRELLARAEPHAHGDAKSGAIAMIEQAATAPARRRIELLRELADFGDAGVGAAARGLLISDNQTVKAVAALVLARLGRGEDMELLDKVAAETAHPAAAREMYFAASLLALDGLGAAVPAARAVDYAEYWLRFALRSYEGGQRELAARYRAAPDWARLELLALLAECGDADQEDVMRQVASSDRPGAERIVALRWLAARRMAPELLRALAAEEGAVGAEAKKALEP
ncbi:MAG: hypothetical protein HS108_16185 [Planctomycetes bacterium]|nr:hypothetical protein [Planctomycetota bacterium]MCL4729236.1 hypothetical protein [Planctomycetota bacterium]